MPKNTKQDLSARQQAFLADIRLWRQASGVSLRKLERETKIHVESWATFERTAHLRTPQYNHVYRRAVAASYARCIGLNEVAMLEAVNQARDDTYDGALRRLMGIDEPEPEPEDEDDADSGQELTSQKDSAPEGQAQASERGNPDPTTLASAADESTAASRAEKEEQTATSDE